MIEIQYKATEDLIPYARNSRTHSAEQIAQIAASIREFGWTNPVLIDGENGIIAGHGRVLAAHKLGETQVPTIELSHMSDTQKRAYIIADNKLALNAGWDSEMLALEIDDLKDAGFDLGLTGFTLDEINALNPKVIQGLTDEDAVPEVPEQPVTVPGDVWVLGKHRLMCGDSTSIDAVDKLMDGQKVDMVLTDPPYGMFLDTDFSTIKGSLKSVGRQNGTSGNKYDKVIGDHGDFTPDLIHTIFACFNYCDEIFLFGADYFAELLPAKNDGSWLVWDKRKDTQAEAIGAEFELLWSRQKHKRRMLRHDWFGFLSSANATEARNREHPTQKPTSLLVDVMEQWGDKENIVADLYGGSGSTLIACEKTNRQARLMELDPKYVDVIIKRWQNFTGKIATHAETGKPFKNVTQNNKINANVPQQQ